MVWGRLRPVKSVSHTPLSAPAPSSITRRRESKGGEEGRSGEGSRVSKRGFAAPLLLPSLFLFLSTSCAGLQLTTIKATQQKPSNVAVYFKVEDNTGAPLAGLTADRFRIYEDDQLVSQYESKQ